MLDEEIMDMVQENEEIVLWEHEQAGEEREGEVRRRTSSTQCHH